MKWNPSWKICCFYYVTSIEEETEWRRTWSTRKKNCIIFHIMYLMFLVGPPAPSTIFIFMIPSLWHSFHWLPFRFTRRILLCFFGSFVHFFILCDLLSQGITSHFFSSSSSSKTITGFSPLTNKKLEREKKVRTTHYACFVECVK